MDLVGKPNTTSPIWNHFHSCHPSAFVQVSSSSRDRKRPAGQVCVGEACVGGQNLDWFLVSLAVFKTYKLYRIIG